MLFLETVEKPTLGLLKDLMEIAALKNFYLAGGTNLALRLGHRTSIDLDIFGELADKDHVVNELKSTFKKDFSMEPTRASWAIFCYIRKIKVDIIGYNHPMLAPLVVVDGIRMASLEDIAAMKVNAVLGRGTKKDFWDIYELLQHFSLAQIIEFYHQKYPDQLLAISIPQAICYFDDAEDSPEPISLKGQKWDKIKDHIQQKVNAYLK